MDLLHSKGYTFNGDAPISGLTAGERNLIVLGHIVRNEQQEPDDSPGSPGSRRKYSEPKRTTDEAMEEYAKKHNLGSYQ